MLGAKCAWVSFDSVKFTIQLSIRVYKLVLTNFILTNGLRAGWEVRMVDFGRSYIKSCAALGGQFVEFDRKSDLCLNFFTHLQTMQEIDDNGKIHTVAYFAPLLAGILLVYIRKKYVVGFIVTALFMGLQIAANHPQMTFYLFIALAYPRGRNADTK